MRISALSASCLLACVSAGGLSQEPLEAGDRWIAAHSDEVKALNRAIWQAAEVGLQEAQSSEHLARFLEAQGFRVKRGVAGMPTAFVAEAGSGRPIVGILAEFDALPGMSQAAEPARRALVAGGAGHACGHSLFGTASTAAAAAALAAAREAGIAGTIRLYGTPAEETGIGKVFMDRAGLFDDLDVALHWHAYDENRVSYSSTKAVVSIKFRFTGRSAHASRSPAAGRSALDAVELMNIGVNFLREHVEQDARMHYVITDGGGQPNVVPATAEVWYYLRADTHAYVEKLLGRVRDIAQGATLMTETTVAEQIDADSFEILPNRPLSELLQAHLERVGAPQFDEAEREFARKTQSDFDTVPPEPLASAIVPLAPEPFRHLGSSDVGNVSWRVPTSGLNVACYTLGAPGHSWQIVACTGTTIGEKGMFVAARTLTGATLDLLRQPELAAAARRDFEERCKTQTAPRSVLAEGQTAPARIR